MCVFHQTSLIWNGEPFKPILDHVNGVNTDNRPQNLRLLCPNCDSQQQTRGGANKGRTRISEHGFARRSGVKWNYTLIADASNSSIGEYAFPPCQKEINLEDCTFDNNTVVAGGLVVADGYAWEVPAEFVPSHSIGSPFTSVTVARPNDELL